jgi:hypothetical protein
MLLLTASICYSDRLLAGEWRSESPGLDIFDDDAVENATDAIAPPPIFATRELAVLPFPRFLQASTKWREWLHFSGSSANTNLLSIIASAPAVQVEGLQLHLSLAGGLDDDLNLTTVL